MFGLRAELFADGFVKTLADWCRAHGIQLTGHVDQEEVVNPVGLCGDLIKVFEHQSMPGLDQIFAYDRGSSMYKVVSSAAVNYGHRIVMTECYGAMDLPVPNLYREAMDQFVKGVNLMVPHAVWYQTNPIMFPPELSYRTEPYASELPRYNQYIGRLQRVLQQGRPVVDIAVLYPIHGLQAAYYFGPGEPYKGGVIPPWADYMDVGERLSLDLRHDFTYLHPETLDARCQVVQELLELQQPECPQQYRVMILPGMEAISATNLAKIKAYYEQGGQIIATTLLPDRSAELARVMKCGRVSATSSEPRPVIWSARIPRDPRTTVHRHAAGGTAWFVENPTTAGFATGDRRGVADGGCYLERSAVVTGGHVSYLHKVIDGQHVWFFTNSSDTPVNTTVDLRGDYVLERWDPHTGRIEPCPATASDGRTTVPLQLAPVTSVFFVSGS